MVDEKSVAKPTVVALPAEIDISNAGTIAIQLREAIVPGIGVLVADLTETDFCDSSGVRILVLARDWATDDGVDLRLVAPQGPTLVVLKLIGLDQLLPTYPTLSEALAAQPGGPNGQSPPGDAARPQAGAPD